MMSMNVRDYVKIYDFLDTKSCKNVVKKLKKIDWQTHQFYTPKQNTYVSYEKELSVAYSSIPEAEEINKKIWHSIDQYITKDCASMVEWFNGWNGYSQVRFNRYEKGTQMKLHCDHIHSMFDGNRKGIPFLSVLGALNDDYEGGELIFWQSERIELKAGQIMLFPSNFMYPHRVDEVTKGTRYSFVSWVW